MYKIPQDQGVKECDTSNLQLVRYSSCNLRYQCSDYMPRKQLWWDGSCNGKNLLSMFSSAIIYKKMQSPTKKSREIIGSMWPTQNWSICPLAIRKGEKNERIATQEEGVSSKMCSESYRYEKHSSKKVYIQADHVADDDLESPDLFVWHMQSGHGKLYIESLGLLSSNPLESLWDRIFNIWRLKPFHLGTKQRKIHIR